MKELESLKKYVIAPNVNFYGGYTHNGENIILCDDHDVDEGYDFKVNQKIVDNVLITELERVYTRKNGKNVTEKSHQEVELEDGELLVYVEGMGFTIPEQKMCLIEEAIGHYELLR